MQSPETPEMIQRDVKVSLSWGECESPQICNCVHFLSASKVLHYFNSIQHVLIFSHQCVLWMLFVASGVMRGGQGETQERCKTWLLPSRVYSLITVTHTHTHIKYQYKGECDKVSKK